MNDDLGFSEPPFGSATIAQSEIPVAPITSDAPQTALAEAVASGSKIIFVPVDDESDRAAAGLAAVSAAADCRDARVVRVGNPLRAPLTLHRLLFQLDSDSALSAEGYELMSLEAACAPSIRGGRTVLVVEQAETLDPSALQRLKRVACLQMILVGREADLSARLRAILTEPDDQWDDEFGDASEAIPGPQPSIAPGLAPAAENREIVLFVPPALGPITLRMRAAEAIGRLLRLPQQAFWFGFSIVAAGATIVAVMVLVSTPVEWPGQPSIQSALADVVLPGRDARAASQPASLGESSVPTATQPPTNQPSPEMSVRPAITASAPATDPGPSSALAPVPLESPLPVAQAPSSIRTPDEQAKLKQEFDAFLRKSGPTTATLTKRERDALFEQYMDWRGKSGRTSVGPSR